MVGFGDLCCELGLAGAAPSAPFLGSVLLEVEQCSFGAKGRKWFGSLSCLPVDYGHGFHAPFGENQNQVCLFINIWKPGVFVKENSHSVMQLMCELEAPVPNRKVLISCASRNSHRSSLCWCVCSVWALNCLLPASLSFLPFHPLVYKPEVGGLHFYF